MKILIINPFDKIPGENFRDQRYTFIYHKLKEKGCQVDWLTADYHHWSHSKRNKKDIPKNFREDFTIIKTLHYKNNVSVKRFLSHFLFSVKSFFYLLNSQKKYDFIFTIIPSENMFLTTIYAKRNKTKVVIDVLDLWPDLFEQAFPKKISGLASVLMKPLHFLSNYSYKRAYHVTAVSRQYMEVALDRSKRNDVENFSYYYLGGAKPNMVNPTKKSSKELKCLFAGQFGHNYDLELILNVALKLKEEGNRKILFYLAGDGFKMNMIKSFINKNDLYNVELLGWLNSDELMKVAAECHIGLNAYKRLATQSIPTKIFDYMSMSLYVLNSLKGEAALMVENELGGSNYIAENINDLYNKLTTLQTKIDEVIEVGNYSKKQFLENYSFDSIYENMISKILKMD